MKPFTYCEDSGRAALVFDTPFSDHAANKSALHLPFLPELLGKPYFAYAADDGRLVVSSWLESVPHFPQALLEGGELIIVNKRTHNLSLKMLYSQCYDLAKLGTDCMNCKKRGRVCMEQLLLKCANEQGLSFTRSSGQPFMEQIDTDEKDDLQKLDKFLRRQGNGSSWVYVPPHLTDDNDLISKGNKRPALRCAVDHDFTCVEEVQRRYSERSIQAAGTRRAVKRCEDECILYPSCDWSTKPYYSAPFSCQNRNHGGYYAGKGPYTLEEIRNNVKLPTASREMVSLFAHNGSLITKIFGHRMHLRRVDLYRGNVEFMPSDQRKYNASKNFTFEDALKLCKIPFRVEGTYKYPKFHEPERLMDDDELRLYSICCEYNETKGHRTMYGWVAPPVLGLEWSPETKSIYVSHNGYGPRTVSEFHHLLQIFGRDVIHHFH